MKQLAVILAISGALCNPQGAKAAIVAGLLSDFQDGTTQGWGGGANPMNLSLLGPGGEEIRVLSIGNGGTWATHNTGTNFSGAIDPGVSGFEVDVARSASETDILALRLVMIGPGTGNRWTSATPELIPNDGDFRTYRFSLLEADLVQVQGTATYAEMTSNVNRVMFRHDPGTPSPGGTALEGLGLLDNIRAVPEPSATLLFCSIGFLCLRRRR